MANQHGDFVWYELMTSDADAAQDFYSGLLGWNYAESGQDGVDYRMFSAGEAQIGGQLQLTPPMVEHGARPAWVGYIRVDDVPAALEKARASGATVLMEGNEVPGVGPFAMLHDPEGAFYYIIDDQSGEESHAFSTHEPKVGHCAWNELMAGDKAAEISFYSNQFGWSVAETMNMGPMGTYDMLKCGADRDFMFGGMMARPPAMPVSMWTFYFRVPDIHAAADYVKDRGGEILNGPMEVPGGDMCINAMDPQGAMFSIIGSPGDKQ
ncbi:VOC family protein [Aurantiacibacter sp. MUD61]|uniref:VOC family protein n=1 Tax=Aurantiacibacter sp. MUD61 TaxID=3009083 RepID=UPI0022F01C5F|nr:VOC family protein [Aurantiacibacter sp. MUD61]